MVPVAAACHALLAALVLLLLPAPAQSASASLSLVIRASSGRHNCRLTILHTAGTVDPNRSFGSCRFCRSLGDISHLSAAFYFV